MSTNESMSETTWQHVKQLAERDGLDDASIFGLAIGCPVHGNAHMDWDEDGIFCHRCQ